MEESSYRWIRSSLTSLSGPGKRSVEAPRIMKRNLKREFKDSKRKKDTEPQKRPETFMKVIGIEFGKSRKIEIRFVKPRNSEHLNIQRLQPILHIAEIDKSSGWNPLNRQKSNKTEMSRVDKGKQWEWTIFWFNLPHFFLQFVFNSTQTTKMNRNRTKTNKKPWHVADQEIRISAVCSHVGVEWIELSGIADDQVLHGGGGDFEVIKRWR